MKYQILIRPHLDQYHIFRGRIRKVGLIGDAVNAARRDFLPIAQDDAKWLADIARVPATALPSTDATPVNRLARFLDSHFVLYFVNGREWYDIHPLIREEVMDVVQAAAPAADG